MLAMRRGAFADLARHSSERIGSIQKEPAAKTGQCLNPKQLLVSARSGFELSESGDQPRRGTHPVSNIGQCLFSSRRS